MTTRKTTPLPVTADFRGRISPDLARILIGHGALDAQPSGLRLVLEPTPAGRLSDAELNDLRGHARRRLPWRPPLSLEVEAVASHPADGLVGTAGFGFWNDPFDPAQGTAAAPNALWFFHASPPAQMPFVPGGAPNGWKAASLNGGAVPEPLVALGTRLLRVPLLNRVLYAVARRAAARAAETVLTSRLDEVHTYRIEWGRRSADFLVDEAHVLRAMQPPQVPLGFVAWVDNNCASETGASDLAWRRLAVPQRQWLEIRRVTITPLGV